MLVASPPSARRLSPFLLQAASDSHTDVSASGAGADDEDDEEEVIPGKMKVNVKRWNGSIDRWMER